MQSHKESAFPCEKLGLSVQALGKINLKNQKSHLKSVGCRWLGTTKYSEFELLCLFLTLGLLSSPLVWPQFGQNYPVLEAV